MGPSLLAVGFAPTLILATLALQRCATLPTRASLVAVGIAGATAATLAWRASRHGRRGADAGLLVALACAAFAIAGLRAADRIDDRLDPSLEGVALRATGVVDAMPTRTDEGARFTLRTERCERVGGRRGRGAAADPADADDADDAPAAPAARREVGGGCALPARLSLSWHASRAPGAAAVPAPRPGERWSLELRLRRPHAPVNFGAFDRELRFLEEGVGGVGTVRAGERLDADAGGPLEAIERARTAIRDAMLEAGGTPPSRESRLLVALAVGDPSAIDPASWTLFNRTGVAHLVSISGVHVTMLAGLVGAAAAFAWRRSAMRASGARLPSRVVGLATAAVVAVAYARLAGWGVPAQRTCLMLCASAALLATRRAPSVPAVLGAAAAVVVAADPWAPLSAGFWLSFGAVAAIVWASSGERRAPEAERPAHRRVLDGLRAAARTQWAATVALLPLGAAFFGTVSVVGPLANAAAIPIVAGAAVPLALAGGLLAPLSGTAAAWVLAPARLLLAGLLAALERLDALPFAAVALPPPGAAALALGCAGAALMLAPAGWPHRRLAALALAPLLAAPILRPAPGELWLTALDVGQGTAAVVQVGDRTLLYDAGPSSGGGDAGARVVVPWLRARGVLRLDAFVVSHADDDHSGGAASVLSALAVERLATSLPDGHPLVAGATRHERCRRGEGWRWGDAAFEWLHPAHPPEPARGSPTNALSCVLRVRSPAGSLLLAGDVEAAQERRLVELFGEGGLAADVLLVPHHGSRTSSTDAFLDAVAPRLAVAQMAYRSRHGHPHPAVVARYDARGVPFARSDADGAVQVRLAAGAAPVVRRARAEPARYWRVPVRPP